MKTLLLMTSALFFSLNLQAKPIQESLVIVSDVQAQQVSFENCVQKYKEYISDSDQAHFLKSHKLNNAPCHCLNKLKINSDKLSSCITIKSDKKYVRQKSSYLH